MNNIIQAFAIALLGASAVVGCGGGGSAPTGGNPGPGSAVPANPVAVKPNVLLLADAENAVVLGFDTLTPSSIGTASAVNRVSGDALHGFEMQVDRSRDLLYSVDTRQNITVYTGASRLSGSVIPVRTIVPELDYPKWNFGRLVLDARNDRLYLAYGNQGMTPSTLAVFDKASTLSGSVKPNRLVTNVISYGRFAIDFKRAILYATSGNADNASVFGYANVDQVNGRPVRAFELSSPGKKGQLAVDSERDVLYYGVVGQGIVVRRNASVGDSTAPSQTMILNDLKEFSEIAVEPSNDRVYVAMDNKVVMINQASQTELGTKRETSNFTMAAGSRIYRFGFLIP